MVTIKYISFLVRCCIRAKPCSRLNLKHGADYHLINHHNMGWSTSPESKPDNTRQERTDSHYSNHSSFAIAHHIRHHIPQCITRPTWTSRRHYYILFFNHWSDNAKNHTLLQMRKNQRRQKITINYKEAKDQWQLENTNGSHLCFHDRTFSRFLCIVHGVFNLNGGWSI